MTSPVAAELLAAVERSPQAASARDRAAWVGLFTDGGRIEDPYGSRPHVGRAQIERIIVFAEIAPGGQSIQRVERFDESS